MDVESIPQLGLPIGQIVPPPRVGNYKNDNWQTQNLNCKFQGYSSQGMQLPPAPPTPTLKNEYLYFPSLPSYNVTR